MPLLDNKMNNLDELRRQLRVPTFCPICSYIMKGSRSNITYYEYGCCDHCYIAFIEGREEKWKSGWRPTQDQINSFYENMK